MKYVNLNLEENTHLNSCYTYDIIVNFVYLFFIKYIKYERRN